MTVLRVSALTAQDTSKVPESTQVKTSTTRALPFSATSMNTGTARIAEMPNSVQVTSCAPRSPIRRPNRPAINEPTSGSRTMATSMRALPQPFIMLMSSTAMEPRLRK